MSASNALLRGNPLSRRARVWMKSARIEREVSELVMNLKVLVVLKQWSLTRLLTKLVMSGSVGQIVVVGGGWQVGEGGEGRCGG